MIGTNFLELGTAMTQNSVVLLEFNELCPGLLDRWMAAGKLPNFKKFHDSSEVYVTEADARAPALEPWIQWHSMHTGVDYATHQVFRLTDGPLDRRDSMWSLLQDAGLKTFNCGSMNTAGYDTEGSVFLPDPWCTSEKAHPAELDRFYRFVSRQVREYSNVENRSALAEALDFLSFMVRRGLRLRTVLDIVQQLAAEKIQDHRLSWRRVAILDWLQTDLFMHYFRKVRPQFSTFFLNSTAHLQHTYWRHMDPDAFTVKPDQAELERYGDAILFGYQNMDRTLGRFFALEKRQPVTLVLASALSQQPFLKAEAQGGQRFYRPRNMDGFLAWLGLKPATTQPVMTHQYMLRFEDAGQAEQAVGRLERLTVDNERLLDIDRRDPTTVYIGSQIRRLLPEDALLGGAGEESRPFGELFYLIDATKSGCHHPDGVLWFKTGLPQRHPDRVSILNVLPTLLDLFDVPVPAHLGEGASHRSLLPGWRTASTGRSMAPALAAG
jgi:hypothetical protein